MKEERHALFKFYKECQKQISFFKANVWLITVLPVDIDSVRHVFKIVTFKWKVLRTLHLCV